MYSSIDTVMFSQIWRWEWDHPKRLPQDLVTSMYHVMISEETCLSMRISPNRTLKSKVNFIDPADPLVHIQYLRRTSRFQTQSELESINERAVINSGSHLPSIETQGLGINPWRKDLQSKAGEHLRYHPGAKSLKAPEDGLQVLGIQTKEGKAKQTFTPDDMLHWYNHATRIVDRHLDGRFQIPRWGAGVASRQSSRNPTQWGIPERIVTESSDRPVRRRSLASLGREKQHAINRKVQIWPSVGGRLAEVTPCPQLSADFEIQKYRESRSPAAVKEGKKLREISLPFASWPENFPVHLTWALTWLGGRRPGWMFS